jgi:hypothetical protein
MTLGSLSINTTCDSNGAGTAYPSGAPEFLMGCELFNVYFYVVYCYSLFVLVMVFNAFFNNISVISLWSVLLMEETGVSGENHKPASSH